MKLFLLILLFMTPTFAEVIKNNSQIEISIKGVPPSNARALNGSYSVYPDGTINLPIIKSVKASGRTPAQLARHLENLYKTKGIYAKPEITVSYAVVSETAPQTITFITENDSKNIPFKKGMTLQIAVAAAGEFTEYCSKRYAYVERGKKSQKYDLKNAEHRNIPIKPNDIIRLPHVSRPGLYLSPPKPKEAPTKLPT